MQMPECYLSLFVLLLLRALLWSSTTCVLTLVFCTRHYSMRGLCADMGAVIYSSGMCVDCYKEYLENAGGQLQGHNPPAYTQGLIKASKQQVGHSF